MDESKIQELLTAIDELGIPTSAVGILRARARGLLTQTEYNGIMEWLYTERGLPRDWWRVLVWSAPR